MNTFETECAAATTLIERGWKEYDGDMTTKDPVHLPRFVSRHFSKRFPSRYDCSLNREKGGVQIRVCITEWRPPTRSKVEHSMELDLYAQDSSEHSFVPKVYPLKADANLAEVMAMKLVSAWEAFVNDDTLSVAPGDHVATFGGESYIDGIVFDDYGIQIGSISIHNVKPHQMIGLACAMVDHLLLNGHRFELRPTHEQDQRTRLVCTDN